MKLPQLPRPSIFLASPGDMSDLRLEVRRMFQRLRTEVVDDYGIGLYGWELEVSESGFDQWRPAQEQIASPDDPLCKAVICLFGERIGSPMAGHGYLHLLGGAERQRGPNGEHLVLDWQSGAEKEGGFPLTGTVFEVLAALAANDQAGRPAEGAPPLKILFLGDDTILELIENDAHQKDLRVSNANWGLRRLYQLGRSRFEDELRLEAMGDWLRNSYLAQLQQLRNFLGFLRARMHVDAKMIVSSHDEALDRCRDFLVRALGYRPKTHHLNPFKGLERYDVADRTVFFGRDVWIGDALDQLYEGWTPDRAPFFGIVGGSGVGKSSLLRAGLIARLSRTSAGPSAGSSVGSSVESQCINRFQSHPGLLISANELLNPSAEPLGGVEGDPAIVASPLGRLLIKIWTHFKPDLDLSHSFDLLATTLPSAIPDRVAEISAQALDGPSFPSGEDSPAGQWLIGLDQFEELIDARVASPDDVPIDLFLSFLVACCEGGRIGFLYTCQTNRLELLSRDSVLGEAVSRNRQKHVPFLREEDIKTIARRKFDRAGIELQTEVVDELYRQVDEFSEKPRPQPGEKLRDLQAGLLPLFSLTLLQLFNHCRQIRREQRAQNLDRRPKTDWDAQGRKPPSETHLTADGTLVLARSAEVDKILKVENAITKLADEALRESQNTPGIHWSEDVLSVLLRRLVRIQNVGDGRLYLPPVAIPKRGAGKILIDALRANRLLLPFGVDRARLVHEAVVSHWPPAMKWQKEEEELLAASRLLSLPAGDWHRTGRSPDQVLDLIGKGLVDRAAKLLSSWFSVFRPRDGTHPGAEDRLLCDFALASLAAIGEPSRVVEGLDSESTHFLTAVYYGEVELVRAYLKKEPNAAREHRSSKGSHAAYAATHSNSLAMLDLVLEHGADPIAANEEEWQPIHVAANNGRAELFDRLVQVGADPNAAGNSGWTALHLATTNDDLGMVRHLLDRYDMELNVEAGGWTPLHSACRYASAELTSLLLDQPGLEAGGVTPDGWSPLMLASRNGKTNAVRRLLRRSDVDPTAKTKAGWTPLQLTVFGKSESTTRALLEDPRVERQSWTPTSKTLVQLAIEERAWAVLECLLEDPHGKIEPDATTEHKQETPLMQACLDGELEAVALLVRGGADVNRLGTAQRSPVLAMAARGDVEMLRLLLPKADLSVEETGGRTALHLAAEEGHGEVIAALLPTANAHQRDHARYLPIHLAARAGHRRAVEVFLESDPTLLSTTDSLGRSAVHLAVGEGHLPLLIDLVERYPWNRSDQQGSTPLHYAARFNRLEIARLLLERQAEPDAVDHFGWTPLHLAAQQGHAEIVRLLLGHEANPRAEARRPPWNALKMAVSTGRTGLIELLSTDREPPSSAELDDLLRTAIRYGQFETALALVETLPRAEPRSEPHLGIAEAAGGHWGAFWLPESERAHRKQLFKELEKLGYLPIGFRPPAITTEEHEPTTSGGEVQAQSPTSSANQRGPADYVWKPADDALTEMLFEQLPPIDGKYKMSPMDTRIETTTLSWYESYRLVRLQDPAWGAPDLRIHYLVSDQDSLYRLNGTSPPIHKVNAKAPVRLSSRNVLDYLVFFGFFVRGEEGPFYPLQTMDDPLIDSLNRSAEHSAHMAAARKVIGASIRPLMLEGINTQGHFICNGVVFYSNALFLADFAVQPSGMVEMLDDEPVVADLPFRITAPIA